MALEFPVRNRCPGSHKIFRNAAYRSPEEARQGLKFSDVSFSVGRCARLCVIANIRLSLGGMATPSIE